MRRVRRFAWLSLLVLAGVLPGWFGVSGEAPQPSGADPSVLDRSPRSEATIDSALAILARCEDELGRLAEYRAEAHYCGRRGRNRIEERRYEVRWTPDSLKIDPADREPEPLSGGLGGLIDRLDEEWRFLRPFDRVSVEILHVRINAEPAFALRLADTGRDDGLMRYHTTVLFVEKRRMLPVRLERYGYPDRPGPRPGEQLERLTYTELVAQAATVRLLIDGRDAPAVAQNPRTSSDTVR